MVLVMENKKFSEAYPRSVTPFNGGESKPDARLVESLQPVFDCSLRFGSELHALLHGEHLSGEQVGSLIQDYVVAEQSRRASMENVFEDTEDTDQNWRVVQSLGFHGMTGAALSIWHKVLSGNEYISPAATKEAQAYLAMETVFEMKDRVDEIAQTGYLPYARSQHGQSRDGNMTESDAYITALEITKKHPHITILPTPLQFESSSQSSRNVDLIAIDVLKKHTLGIQVKTQASIDSSIKYDSRYAMLIDGKIDLDNVKQARVSPKQSKTIAVNWPGLVSAHFLLENPSTRTKKRTTALLVQDRTTALSSQQNARQARYLARTLVANTKSKNKEAATRIEDRLLHNLYKE